MNKTTSIKFLINTFLLVLINLFTVTSYAEGTPQVSPNPATSITALLGAKSNYGIRYSLAHRLSSDSEIQRSIIRQKSQIDYGMVSIKRYC